jgi:hypothetical protein
LFSANSRVFVGLKSLIYRRRELNNTVFFAKACFPWPNAMTFINKGFFHHRKGREMIQAAKADEPEKNSPTARCMRTGDTMRLSTQKVPVVETRYTLVSSLVVVSNTLSSHKKQTTPKIKVYLKT